MEEIKKQLKEYRDFFGLEIHLQEDIENATSYKELGEVLDNYHHHIEMMANDAQNHLKNFRRKIGLDDNINNEDNE